MQNLLSLLVIFVAIFTQSVTGFGSGLVSMAFLPAILGVRTAVPLVALITGTLELLLLIRLRSSFNISAVKGMALTSILAIPIGVLALRKIDEDLLLSALGVVMAGYSLYALFNFKLPRLEHPAWAWVAGFLSGLLSGAYSVGGPPAIIYGNCHGWQPKEFKSNLQGLFLLNDSLALITHAIAGNLTPSVWKGYLWALPVIALGIFIGAKMDRWIEPQTFRKIVLGLLIVMGVKLILSAL
jgi:hypothetical protein